MNLTPIMDRDALNRFLETDFPQIHTDGKVFEVTEVGPGTVVMRLDPNERHLRPGGTVSGPTLFALADVGAYCAVLAHIGPVALAVTTNLNINFLRKPEPGPPLLHLPAAQARQAAGRHRGFDFRRECRGSGGACDRDLFDSTAIICGIKTPQQ